MSDGDPEVDDYPPSFDGHCTCEHASGERDYGECRQKMPDGSTCPCEAGWSE